LENPYRNLPPPSNRAHRAYLALPEDHVRREADKTFSDGLEDLNI
jgi:hypothetical protein